MTKEKDVYESEAEFREAVQEAWENYLDSLEDGQEPQAGMTFVGVIKVGKRFQVMRAVFNAKNQPN